MSINRRILLQCSIIFAVFSVLIVLIMNRFATAAGYDSACKSAEALTDLIQLSDTLYVSDSTVLVTAVGLDGCVLEGFAEEDEIDESLSRDPEMIMADKYGKGRHIRKIGDDPYLFFVKKYPDRYLRVAKPVSQISHLQRSSIVPTVTIIMLFLAAFLCFYAVARKFGHTIASLKTFIERVDSGARYNFPEDDLREICEYIITMYKHLDHTKKALNMEREKLMAHLKLSKRGLAIFSPQRKEIISNELFMQYINLISDKQRRYSENAFEIPELYEIVEFLDDRQLSIESRIETKTIQVNKNDTILLIHCIVFQDKSFEITIDDITQKEEQALIKKQLTQNISHELKTPVASIQGFMETILLNPNLDEEKRTQYIKRCYEQANRLTNLLQDISTLNKLDEATDMFVGEEVNLTNIIHGVLEDLSLKIEEKGFNVELDIPKDLMIEGNYSLLYSIFRNLMDNAIAYAGDNVTVHISCYRNDKDFYYFSFYDTGVGVEEQHLGRLFDRFYRVDKGRSRKLGGTGLGLAIVKNAVLFHHGRISAKNHQGGGLEFLFTLKKTI